MTFTIESFAPESPLDLINEKITPEVESLLMSETYRINIGDEFFKHMKTLTPTVDNWAAYMDAEVKITNLGVTNLSTIALKSLTVFYPLFYKDGLIGTIQVEAIYHKERELFEIEISNTEQLILSINKSICISCYEHIEKCSCRNVSKKVVDSLTEESFSEYIEATYFAEVEDKSGILSKKEIVYSMKKEEVEAIISGMVNSLGYKRSDVTKTANIILSRDPEIKSQEFATKLITELKRS